jgi:CheY-like chemotaxis protein
MSWDRVLVVDDSKVYREVMTTLLRSHCRSAVAVSSVAEAIERLEAEGGFDLVICDVMMEGEDGFCFLERVRERDDFGMPVVMVTGRSNPDGAVRARELGAAGYLEKPTTVRQILNAVVPPPHAERRNHPRTRCNGIASLVDPDSGQPGPLLWDLYDLSLSGAFLETKGPLPVGCELHLLLRIGGREARALARVVRIQQPSWLEVGGVGVRFVDPDEALRELIAWAIQRSLAAPEGA